MSLPRYYVAFHLPQLPPVRELPVCLLPGCERVIFSVEPIVRGMHQRCAALSRERKRP